jgi:glyoxylase-like metal-dependent hydrolase (beta-lactamase superfamily II)
MLGPLAERGLLGGSDIGTRVALLTGSQATAARRTNLLDIVSGDAGIVVGTHALIQDTVDFQDLGLVVVDEQHRFGVEQRDALRNKAKVPPHLLVMTATPIPRTVAMTVFGDLDVSTLTELPAGRSPIASHVVPAGEKPHFLERAWTRVREEVDNGHQVYVVCPRIGAGPEEEADDVPADVETTSAVRPALAVLDVMPMLVDGPLAGLRVEMLHGRMPPDAKDDVMRRFAAGEVDVLVATTVVEVGVDVANATGMVVMDADRFGVSQLHQLRGRVGRGSAPGLCLLVTDSEAGTPARDRLDAVAATQDGFELSRLDLETRREGDVLGASQSGRRSSLRLLSVLRDEAVIADARKDAAALVAADPDLGQHPALRAAVEAVLADRDARVVAVLVTHHHGDHAEAALPWGGHFGAPVAAASPAVAGPDGRLLEAGERLSLAGTTVRVVATPGHTSDHLAFRLESGAVLVGDHVLGRGTSVVTHPEGDVVAYLESLRRVHDLGPSALYCGHGPELTEDPGAVLDFYAAHRAYRERQLLDALATGPRTVDGLVAIVYAAVPRELWPAAAQSTRATLGKLSAEGRVALGADDTVTLG